MKRQRGNILFLILLAVVLFAALSYAVTSSTRGGGNNASKESATATASELYQYLVLMDNTLDRLRLVNGCTESQFDFSNTVWLYGPSGARADTPVFPVNHNSAAPGDGRCKLFSYMPAQISDAAIVETAAGSWARSMHPWIISYSIPGIGTSAYDLVIAYPTPAPEVCKAFNRLAGINLSTDGAALPIGWPVTSYAGIYNGLFNAGNTANSNATGLRDYCSAGGIIHVLIAR